MSITICVSGEGNIYGATREQLNKIRKIGNGYDEDFEVEATGRFEFLTNLYESNCNVYQNFILNPLNKLIIYARENDLGVNAEFTVISDVSDFNNIVVIINDNELRTCNSEIVNASDEELEKELKRRQSRYAPKSLLGSRDANGNVEGLKIYGLTIISSDGDILISDENGRVKGYAESYTKLFTDAKERLDYAKKELGKFFSAYDFEGNEDFTSATPEELKASLDAGTNVYIQGPVSHTTFELFEQDIEPAVISIETPKGRLFAQTKSVKDEYPGIWITKDDTNPAHIVAVVEYDTSREKLEASAYSRNEEEPVAIVEYETGENLPS